MCAREYRSHCWAFIGGRALPCHPAWRRLAKPSQVIRFRTVEEAISRPRAIEPRVALLLQDAPAQFSDDQLLAWRRVYPLTPVVIWQGPWVSGTGVPLNSQLGVWRYKWWEADAVRRALEYMLEGSEPHAGRLSTDPPPVASAPLSLGLWSADDHYIHALRMLVERLGWIVVSEASNRVDVTIFDHANRTDWTRHDAWRRCDRRWGLVDFPRPAERRRLVVGRL